MVVNTAGHWTTGVFSKVEPPGMEGILSLFEVAMERWAEEVQSALRTDVRNGFSYLSRFRLGSKKRKERRAVVRAYLPGHYNCHDFRHPWNEVQPAEWYPWNWADIPKFNAIFEKLLLSRLEFCALFHWGSGNLILLAELYDTTNVECT